MVGPCSTISFPQSHLWHCSYTTIIPESRGQRCIRSLAASPGSHCPYSPLLQCLYRYPRTAQWGSGSCVTEYGSLPDLTMTVSLYEHSDLSFALPVAEFERLSQVGTRATVRLGHCVLTAQPLVGCRRGSPLSIRTGFGS